MLYAHSPWDEEDWGGSSGMLLSPFGAPLFLLAGMAPRARSLRRREWEGEAQEEEEERPRKGTARAENKAAVAKTAISGTPIRVPDADLLEAWLMLGNESEVIGRGKRSRSGPRYFVPQRTLADGNCMLHATLPDARPNQYGSWEAPSSSMARIRERVSAEMKENGSLMKQDFSGRFYEEDWHKDSETKRYCLTDEAWNRWCNEIRLNNTWFDVSATQALARVLKVPIMVIQPRPPSGKADAEIEEEENTDESKTGEGLVDKFIFTFHDPRSFTPIRFYRSQSRDLELCSRLLAEHKPILVYFNSTDHFSRCSEPEL